MVLYKLSGELIVDSDEALIASTQNRVCEVLAFCVQSHGYRIKYFILRHNVVQKALGYISPTAKATHLTMAVIRFVRACVGLKDEFYNRHLVKNNLFAPIMATFIANGSKYNLLNSAIVEMIDFIRRGNIKSLVTYIVDNFRECFDQVIVIPVFVPNINPACDLIFTSHQNRVYVDVTREPSCQVVTLTFATTCLTFTLTYMHKNYVTLTLTLNIQDLCPLSFVLV